MEITRDEGARPDRGFRQRKALNTSDFFGFWFFGFHFEYGLITDETSSRRQISIGTKFEVSHFIIFS